MSIKYIMPDQTFERFKSTYTPHHDAVRGERVAYDINCKSTAVIQWRAQDLRRKLELSAQHNMLCPDAQLLATGRTALLRS